MLLFATFLFNLLCGLVPCDPNYGDPIVSSGPYNQPDILSDGRTCTTSSEIGPVVTLPSGGRLEGYRMKTVKGRPILAFEGIRYGRAERWKSPTPEEWTGTLKANKRGSDCLQLSLAKYVRVYGSEDCLFANVFSPRLPCNESGGNNRGYPVIIYLHSGAFFMGSGSEHGPAYLLERNVVLVTVNYRLGVLGFLSTGDASLPGNYGLKDQALALEWVHKNIAAFGGDPDNINLVGYSAGGISSHLHMISNRTRHLFKRVASLGAGSAMQYWAVQSKERARYYANRVGRRLRCPTNDSSELVQCLKKVPVNTLVADSLNLFDWFPFPAVLTVPVVEPPHPEAFILETPEEAYKRGHVAKKPWITGTTSREGMTAVLVLELFQRWLPFRLNWKLTSKAYLDLNYFSTVFGQSVEDVDQIVDKVSKFYLNNKPVMQGRNYEFASMISHRFFQFGVLKGLQAHSAIAPSYAYYFSFDKGNYNMGNMYGHKSSEWGPGHAEDEYYYFNTSTQHPGFRESDPDYKMSQVMVNFLVNFATTGEPIYTTEAGESVRVWEPFTQSHTNETTQFRMLQYNQEVKMIDYPDMKALQFWQNLNLMDMNPWVPIKL